MNTQLTAPDFPSGRPGHESGYPSKGAKLGPAWQMIWDRLNMQPGQFQDGYELADAVAPAHDLQPSTLIAVLSRAATAGLLEREHRPVKTGRGNRNRTFYRIAGQS